MHKAVLACELVVAAGTGMKDQMIVASENVRQCAEVRFVLAVEESRKSTWGQHLPVWNPFERLIRQIGRPLLSGVIHHYVKVASKKKVEVSIGFSLESVCGI